MAIRRRQHDFSAPHEFARGVAIGDKCLKPGTVIGIQVKANVIAFHTVSMTQPEASGNLMSGAEH
jgi:hypothetical protein